MANIAQIRLNISNTGRPDSGYNLDLQNVPGYVLEAWQRSERESILAQSFHRFHPIYQTPYLNQNTNLHFTYNP